VGLGVVPAAPSGALFRDELGRINATLSALSDHVALVVAGRVLDLSAAPVVGD
jgi:adenosylcobinamide kinase/adenosylcobinamide-phosphate guanylyltransferase